MSSLPMPAELAPLHRNLDGEPATGCFNYASIVGMLHYLNHTRHPPRLRLRNPSMCSIHFQANTLS
ncbi:hypothetical protein ACHAWF_000748 [Thalassiosira exigua]